MNSETPHSHPVRSTFADDPTMHELIEFFVDEIPSRIDALEQAWQEQDSETVMCLSHQLKGASGGYGVQVISDAAKALEHPLKQGEEELENLSEQFSDLIDLCNRVMF